MIYDEKQRHFLRALCDRSFYHFVKIVGGYVHQGGIITDAIHRPLCQFSQDKSIKRKAIFTPRDWLKSTVFTKWKSIWDYLQDHEHRVLIASENENIASRFLDFMERQILQNTMIRWLYPELAPIDKGWTRSHRWSSTQCELPRQGIYSEPTFTSIGIGSAAQSGHYTKIAIDDPTGKSAMESMVVLEGVFRWVDNCTELLVNPNPDLPDGSEINIEATFWGPGDFGSYVMEKYPEFQFRIVPALKDIMLKDVDNVKWVQHAGVMNWETNWPESDKFTTKYYLDMQANPEKEMIFWSQHQNNPRRASQLTKFDPSWFRYCHLEDMFDHDNKRKPFVVLDDKVAIKNEKENVPVEDVDWYGFIDPGGFAETKTLKKGSRNAIIIAGKPRDGSIVIIAYAWAGRLKSPADFCNEVIKAHKLWKPRWMMEVFGQQEYIRKSIIEVAKEQQVPLSILPVSGEVTEGAKDRRITEVIGPLQAGRIYFLRSIPHLSDLKQEFRNFPNSITVDLIDAFAYLWQIRFGRGVGTTRGAIEDANKKRYAEYLQAHQRG